MDIDSRSFIDVMKDLSSQTGIELPKTTVTRKNWCISAKAKPVKTTGRYRRSQEN